MFGQLFGPSLFSALFYVRICSRLYSVGVYIYRPHKNIAQLFERQEAAGDGPPPGGGLRGLSRVVFCSGGN